MTATSRIWRSPELAAAVAAVEASLDERWAEYCAQWAIHPGSPDETVLAEQVCSDPAAHDWRVVDAALARLSCPACRQGLGAGPRGCPTCDLHDGMRFAAQEHDRPGVPPGNEHAIRVASVVARTRHRYSPRARVGYELVLPALLAGELPTTAQAQASKALINRLTPEECDRVRSMDEVRALAAR